jgi:hypothetical protein
MTNLMHQLQAWAGEGRYDFECRRLKTPYGWIDASDVDFMVNQRVDFIKKDYRLRHGQLEKLKLVLDGTIQVWRPVEHYDVPCKEKVRRNPQKPVLFLHTDSTTTLETPWHWCEGLDGYIYSPPKRATHWQPLPQPPQEVSHA